MQTDVAQAGVMISSVVIVALFGIVNVGGLTEVWNHSVEGGRIATEYAKLYSDQNLKKI